MNCKTGGPLVFFMLLVALGGCWRSEKPIEFYLLNADAAAQVLPVRPLPSSASAVVGLGPVNIPEYLNRPQMVLGVAENQYQLDEQHRWAERLDQNIQRALLKSLSAQLGQIQIVRHPWPSRQSVDYQTNIDILELHWDATGMSRMSAQWWVRNREGRLTTRRFDCNLPVRGKDFDAFVKAQSECLARLSSEIADTLAQLLTANRRIETRARRRQ